MMDNNIEAYEEAKLRELIDQGKQDARAGRSSPAHDVLPRIRADLDICKERLLILSTRRVNDLLDEAIDAENNGRMAPADDVLAKLDTEFDL